MEDKKKLKKYETVWVCDFCGKEFKIEDEAGKHELSCSKNPQNRNNITNYFWIYLIGSILLIWIVFSLDDSKSQKIKTYTEDGYYSLEEELDENKIALEEANHRIEEVKYYAWESYEDMGHALEDLETVNEP